MSKVLQNKIIFSNSIDKNEALKTWSLFGLASFNTRILGTFDICKYTLNLNNIKLNSELIDSSKQNLIYYSILSKIDTDYFKYTNYTDIIKIANSIDKIRKFYTSNNKDTIHSFWNNFINKSQFKKKNTAIYKLYKQYTDYKLQNNLIDEIDLIKFTLNLKNVKYPNKQLCIFIKENLTPLDLRVLSKFDTVDTDFKFYKYINNSNSNNKDSVFVDTFVKSYGACNEVEWIINKIYQENLPLDQTQIVIADNIEYSQLFYNLCINKNIPANFKCGVGLSNSNAFNVLSNLNTWNKDGFNGSDYLKQLIINPSFDTNKLLEDIKFNQIKCEYNESNTFSNPNYDISIDNVLEMCGNLKLSFDKQANDRKLKTYEHSNYKFPTWGRNSNQSSLKNTALYECAKNLANIIEKGLVYIVDQYTNTQTNNTTVKDFELASKKQIINELTNFLNIYSYHDLPYLIDLLSTKLCKFSNTEDGQLLICNIEQFNSMYRKYIFICGMSADNFPGNFKEDFLILDNDYCTIEKYNLKGKETDVKIYYPTSTNVIKDKLDKLKENISISNKLGCNVYVSWPYFNLTTLRYSNPSSFLYMLKKNNHTSFYDLIASNQIENAGFFNSSINKYTKICRKYIDGYVFQPHERHNCNNAEVDMKKSKFSPTELEKFLHCEKRFFYDVLLGLNCQENDDPNIGIQAITLGSILHDCYKKLSATNKNSKYILNKDEFISYGINKFEDYFKYRPPISKHNYKKILSELNFWLSQIYDQDKKIAHKTILYEKYISKKISNFIEIGGYPDRIEVNENNNVVIVDLKTGSSNKHFEKFKNKYPDGEKYNAIQGLLYAYIYEQNKNLKNINSCSVEFRYPRLFNKKAKTPDVIRHKYNKDFCEGLLDKLNRSLKEFEFNNLIESNVHSSLEESYCKYCPYLRLCNTRLQVTSNE